MFIACRRTLCCHSGQCPARMVTNWVIAQSSKFASQWLGGSDKIELDNTFVKSSGHQRHDQSTLQQHGEQYCLANNTHKSYTTDSPASHGYISVFNWKHHLCCVLVTHVRCRCHLMRQAFCFVSDTCMFSCLYLAIEHTLIVVRPALKRPKTP